MLRDNVHGDLGQIHVGPDSSGGGDAGLLQDLLYHHPDQIIGAAGIDGSIGSDIDEHFVDRIDMDILRRKEL